MLRPQLQNSPGSTTGPRGSLGMQGPIVGTWGVSRMERVVLTELARDAAKQKEFLQIPSVFAHELL